LAAIDCAKAILKFIDNIETAVVLVAIAGAESGWRENAAGDCRPDYTPWICNAGDCRCGTTCSSFGPWQINIYWNREWLPSMVGSSNPCTIARWLLNYDNNARAAAKVLERQGLGAWKTYKTGAYKQFLDEARNAVNAVISAPPPPPPQVRGSYRCVSDDVVVINIWWNPVPGASWYEIWHANTKLATVRTTSFEHRVYSSYWKTGAVYTLGIKACNNNGCSALSTFRVQATCKTPALTVAGTVAAILGSVALVGTGAGLLFYAYRENIRNWFQRHRIIKLR